MQTNEVINCCTASIMFGFGGTETADIDGYAYRPKAVELIEYHRGEGEAVLIAFTNNEQKGANEMLKSLGFKRTKSMSKYRHPETKLILWWLPLQGWVDPQA